MDVLEIESASSHSYSVQEVRRRERNANKWPVVVSFTCVDFFTVHTPELSLGEVIRHRLKNLFLFTFLGEDNAHVEGWRNSETEDSVNVGADDLQMHEGHEQFLEALSGGLVEL